MLSAGPAITHAVTGILVAHDNDLPLLVVGGCRPLDMRGKGTFQDLDAVAIFRPITRHAALVATPDGIAPALDLACGIALEGRPGPVYLDIAEETLHGRTVRASQDAPAAAARAGRSRRHRTRRRVAAQRIASRPAGRRALCAGRVPHAPPPASSTRSMRRSPRRSVAQGFVPDDHRLCVNAVRAGMLSTADVVLVAGTPLDWRFRFGGEIARGAVALLARGDAGAARAGDGARRRSRASARRARPCARAREPASRRSTVAGSPTSTRPRSAARQDDALAADAREPMTEHRLAAEVRRVLPQDAFLAVDGNRTLGAVQRMIRSVRASSRLTPAHGGCMGVGVPFGIGVALAQPGRPVVVVTGDLALGLCVMELETAVRIGAPVVVVVANNEGNAGGRQERKLYPDARPDRVTQFQPGQRYDAIARELGAHAERVERIDELAPAFLRALASGRTALLDVAVDVLAP